tara:strand:+ start:123 stop:389 length:267 start_codon:yes stop_codon:yes gene_type:complete
MTTFVTMEKEIEIVDELSIFMNRLKRIGIKIKVSGNLPWVYLDSVNGNRVKEKGNQGNHGWNIAWFKGSGHTILTDTEETFKLLRKYK